MQQYTVAFKDQAVTFVFDEIGPFEARNEACNEACRLLAPKLNLNEITFHNRVKAASPTTAIGTVRAGHAGAVDELRAKMYALRKENRELVRANDILKLASVLWCGARPPIKEVTAFVFVHSDTFGLEPICRMLQVATSTVGSCLARPISAREIADEVLKPKIQRMFDDDYQVYGRRKIKAGLRREYGLIVDKDRAASLMAELVMDALNTAVWPRRANLLDGVIAHSDTVNALYKTKLIKRQGPWRNADHVELATITYVEWFNHRRLPAKSATSHYLPSSKPTTTINHDRNNQSPRQH